MPRLLQLPGGNARDWRSSGSIAATIASAVRARARVAIGSPRERSRHARRSRGWSCPLCEVAFRPSSTSTSRVWRRSGEALCEVVHDVHDVMTSVTLRRPPGTDRRTRGGRRRRSRCTSFCWLPGYGQPSSRGARISAVIGRETPPPAALAEGRPSGRLPRSSRAVDVPAALRPTYVVSVVRCGRVNVVGVAITSTTCQ